MKRFGIRKRKTSAGKVITAALIGSVVGATVGLLMAPTTGEELRHKLQGGAGEAREKLITAAANVETRARELAAEVGDRARDARGAVSRGRKITTANS